MLLMLILGFVCFVLGCIVTVCALEQTEMNKGRENCSHSFVVIQQYTESGFFGIHSVVISRCVKCGKLKKDII